MTSVLISFLSMVRGVMRSRATLHLEVLALRHQLEVLQRSRPRPLRLTKIDRWLWARLSRSWSGYAWRTTAAAIGIEEILTDPRSPWQNAYAECLIGSIRRECLDHIMIANERGLRRALAAYVEYYQRSRTHLSLDKDSPVPRETAAPSEGRVVAIPQVGGLHHRYERRAA